MTWQPIETAPKDGTSVLVYDPNPYIDPYSVFTVVWDCERKGWVETAGEGYAMYHPTHWMPTPMPPEVNNNDLGTN